MSNLAVDMKRFVSLQTKSRTKNAKSTINGKSVDQVRRRNARERNRVQQINNGYTVLARSVAGWKECKNKNKMSKVETLRNAVNYIKHLEEVLTKNDSTKPFDYSSYLPQKMESHDLINDSMACNYQNSCFTQYHDQRLSASTTCSSGYDSAYASPTFGQPFSHSQMFMNMQQPFYGISHHENSNR